MILNVINYTIQTVHAYNESIKMLLDSKLVP